MSNNVRAYTGLKIPTLAEKNGKIISSKQALENVKPINWSEDILQGTKKVVVTKEVIE